MKPYSEMTKEELLELKRDLSDQYREFQGKNLTLDMSRGKPSAEQLDLSMGMMDVLSSDSDLTCEDGQTAAITAVWTVSARRRSC